MRNLSLSRLEADNLARSRQDAIYGGEDVNACTCGGLCYACFCDGLGDDVRDETTFIGRKEEPTWINNGTIIGDIL